MGAKLGFDLLDVIGVQAYEVLQVLVGVQGELGKIDRSAFRLGAHDAPSRGEGRDSTVPFKEYRYTTRIPDFPRPCGSDVDATH
jgi:hypothetical protein